MNFCRAAVVGVVAALMAVHPLAAQAPKGSALARIEAAGGLTGAAYFCQQLSYRVDEEAMVKSLDALAQQGEKEGLSDKAIQRAFKSGAAAEAARLKAWTSQVGKMESGEALKAQLTASTDHYGEICARAAADPDKASGVSAPAGHDLAAAKTAYIDSFVEPLGLASWQTPKIVERGNYLYTLGACQGRLGQARTRELAQPLTGVTVAVEDERERAYYASSLEDGVKAIKKEKMTADACAAVAATQP